MRTCPLAGVAEKSSSELQEAGVPRSAPEHTDRAQPGADPGLQREILSNRRRRLLFAVCLCLGPGSTTGYRGVRGKLWSRAPPPVTDTSSLHATGPCVSSWLGPALRRALLSPEPAARRRRDCCSPREGRAMVQPGSHCLPLRLQAVQRPLGVSPSLCKGPIPGHLPGPEFPRFLS